MRRRGKGIHVAVALTIGTLFAVLPGPATARTGIDPCTVAEGQDPRPFTETGRVCSDIVNAPAYENVDVGGPRNAVGRAGLPATEPRQCPPETYIPGTISYSRHGSNNWDWDFWADGGYWILYNDSIDNWPDDLTVMPGAYSIIVELANWNVYYPVKTRVFWNCKPIPPQPIDDDDVATAAVAGPLALEQHGDEGDDTLRGDAAQNPLIGHAGDDRLIGLEGNDHLNGGGGDDQMSGGADDDLFHGKAGDDVARGATGRDDLLTGQGDDLSYGGPGPDQLFDNEGRDHLTGGSGNDRFSTHDGDRDVIDCGAGEDIAMIDRFDRVSGCEHAWRNKREAPKRMPSI